MARHLHIIQTLDLKRSGGLVGVVTLHDAMLSSGISSKLIYNRTFGSIAGPSNSLGLNPVFSNRFYFGWRSARIIEQAARSVDIIHVHGLYTYMNYVAGRVAVRHGKRLVYHPHGALAPAYRNRGRIKKSAVLLAFERENFARLAAWRALTATEAAQICEYVPGARVVVVSNGIPVPADTSRVLGSHSHLRLSAAVGRKVFLFISRIAAVKGLDLLLDAWAANRTRLDGCELWIAGPDFDGTTKLLRDQIAAQRLENVILLGAVSEVDKEWMIRAADIFVLPSRGEGQSSAILEAMAYGKPILITEKCYFPLAAAAGAGLQCEVSAEGIGGLLTRFEAMSDDTLVEMGRSARVVIRERFDIQKVAKELDEKMAAIMEEKT